MTKAKKTIIIITAVLVVAAGICAAVFLSAPKPQTVQNTEMLPPEKTKYSADENGGRIVDIPYEEYARECTLPKQFKTVEGLLPNNHYDGNTELIQAAINNLAEKDGGTVYIPAGEYYIKSITLKSNITLFIDKDCILYSVPSLEYSLLNNKYTAVINAEKAENISVTGGGTIVGFGENFAGEAETTAPLCALKEFNLYTRVIEAAKRQKPGPEGSESPHVIGFKNCSGVKISSLTIKDPARRAVSLLSCSNIKINDLVIDGDLRIPYSDGIVMNGVDGAEITHCFIASGGDAVAVKSSLMKAVDVEVSDCELCSFSDCFRIGDETNYNVQNISVKQCYLFIPSGITGGYSGISIESADGSKISAVDIEDIKMDGVSSPLLIWLGDRLERSKKEAGSIHDVKISKITASNVELPCAVTGCKVKNVYDIELSNFNISYRDTEENLDVKDPALKNGLSSTPGIMNVSHRPGKTAEKSLYYSLPCSGLYVRYAESITVSNFECTPRSCSKLEIISVDNAVISEK